MDGFTCNLKTYRVLKGMTQGELADIVGVRRETIMRLEKAQYNPSLKLAVDIPGPWRPLLRQSSYLTKNIRIVITIRRQGFPALPRFCFSTGNFRT